MTHYYYELLFVSLVRQRRDYDVCAAVHGRRQREGPEGRPRRLRQERPQVVHQEEGHQHEVT